MKIVVSLSAHESELSIVDQCLNYICVGEVDGVVVHLNALGNVDPSLLAALIDQVDLLRGRVQINPVRLPLYPMRKRVGGTAVLHRAHVANFSYARQHGPVDIFCMDASNCLLIKNGLREHVQSGVGATLQINKKWVFHRQLAKDKCMRPFRRAIRVSHHEGMFFDRATFGKMCELIEQYEECLAKTFPDQADQPEYPREEILFSMAYQYLTTPRSSWLNWFSRGNAEPQPQVRVHEPFIWLRWETELNWPLAEVQELLKNPVLPDGKFGIKRIARDFADPVRAVIGNYFNYRHLLEAASERVKSAQARNGSE